jgi:fido (protein-threonine AMPylation protein)
MHRRLVTIHPYIGGSGRTARLVMNLILLRHGYPIANLSADQRLAYLQRARKGAGRGRRRRFPASDRERRKDFPREISGNGVRQCRRGRRRQGTVFLRTD